MVIPSSHPVQGTKKKEDTGHINCPRTVFELVVSVMAISLTFWSTAADTIPMDKNKEIRIARTRVNISMKKGFITVYRNDIKNANILALICLSSLFFYNPPMRIWFFGTPSLSASVLQNLLNCPDIEVVFVVTNPDKPIGRSGDIQPTQVKLLAWAHNITVFTPIRLRDNIQFFEELRSYDCDYFIVVAYGKIVPQEILDIPKKMCINVHGSILPKYRWASPIQSALLHWEKETWVTIMEMSIGMDEGNILKICTIPINPTETAATLFTRFAEVSPPTLIQTLRELELGGITSLPQDNSRATYCKKIEKEDGFIDWSKKAKEIYHMWQAYMPWPGIYTQYEGKRLLLEQVESRKCKVESVKPWTVLKLEDGRVWVVCGEWILTLEQVKLEWKKSQSILDFVNWNQQFISSIL